MSSFNNAPVTKGLMISLGALSLLSSMFDIKHYLHLQLVPHISRDRQFWRLLVHQFASTHSGELLLFETIIFCISISVERQFGSYKYASFLLVITALTTCITFIGLVSFHRLGLNKLSSGPYALVFAVLAQYYCIIPPTYQFKIGGVSCSDKFHVYVLCFQLALIRMPGTMLAASSGLFAGYLYRSDILGLKSYRLPSVFRTFGNQVITPLIGSTRPPRRSNIAMPEPVDELEQHPVQRQPEANSAETPPEPTTGSSVVRSWVNSLTGRTPGIRVPSQEEINEVSAMFPLINRQTVVLALQRSPTREVAVEALLLASQSVTST